MKLPLSLAQKVTHVNSGLETKMHNKKQLLQLLCFFSGPNVYFSFREWLSKTNGKSPLHTITPIVSNFQWQKSAPLHPDILDLHPRFPREIPIVTTRMTYILRLSQCQNLSFDTGGKGGQLDSLYPGIFFVVSLFSCWCLELTLPETDSSILKIDGWFRWHSFWETCPIFHLQTRFQGVRRFLCPNSTNLRSLVVLGSLKGWVGWVGGLIPPFGWCENNPCKLMRFQLQVPQLVSFPGFRTKHQQFWPTRTSVVVVDPMDIVGTFEVFFCFNFPPCIMTDLWKKCVYLPIYWSRQNQPFM